MERSEPGAGIPGHTPHPRPPVEAADLDPARRPGVPKERPPEPWPNSRPAPAHMTARPASPVHGRPGKQLPPVYGTAVPLRGLSGAIRRMAYRLPDHAVNHWTLLLLGDRVQSWEVRAGKALRLAVPLLALALLARRALRA